MHNVIVPARHVTDPLIEIC